MQIICIHILLGLGFNHSACFYVKYSTTMQKMRQLTGLACAHISLALTFVAQKKSAKWVFATDGRKCLHSDQIQLQCQTESNIPHVAPSWLTALHYFNIISALLLQDPLWWWNILTSCPGKDRLPVYEWSMEMSVNEKGHKSFLSRRALDLLNLSCGCPDVAEEEISQIAQSWTDKSCHTSGQHLILPHFQISTQQWRTSCAINKIIDAW